MGAPPISGGGGGGYICIWGAIRGGGAIPEVKIKIYHNYKHQTTKTLNFTSTLNLVGSYLNSGTSLIQNLVNLNTFGGPWCVIKPIHFTNPNILLIQTFY